jgi:NAD(P)-dependent dehydrogenase (short-subunit alcohol dehydrogenase family)
MNHPRPSETFHERVAIVTGGASGIGRALCEELSQQGSVVVVADVNIEGAKEVVRAIDEQGRRVLAAHVNVAHAEQVQALVDETISAHGRLDYMFNNAGIAMVGEVRDMSLTDWRQIVDVNLWGVIHGTTAAYAAMVEQGAGHIVNVTSLAGLVPGAAFAAYVTTKQAVVGLSMSLRVEGEALGVKVSVVCPGFVRTSAFDTAVVLNADHRGFVDRMPTHVAMEATQAARVILRGVAHNRAIIPFPFYVRLLWWLYRLHPALLVPFSRRVAGIIRAVRCETEVIPDT